MPQSANFHLDDYLARIAYQGELACDIETLRNIMQQQLYSIPFENLDVIRGGSVSLKPDDIVHKLLVKKRGGYCYEVNGLFCMALVKLGFEYEMHAARPRYNYTDLRPKTHMIVVVKLEGESWLCDAGFGAHGIRQPINISQLPTEVKQGPDCFKIEQISERDYLLQIKLNEQWVDLYSYELFSQAWVDYSLPNFFNYTSSESIFTNRRIAVLQQPMGRRILVDNELKLSGPNGRERVVVDESNLDDILSQYFSLHLRKEGVKCNIDSLLI